MKVINGIDTYTVSKVISDSEMLKQKNNYIKPSQIHLIIKKDADVYTEDGKLLLRFRKNKISKESRSMFYDNVIQFATLKTNNRGSASGSKTMDVKSNPKIMTNVIGYFDKFSPKQKQLMKQQDKHINISVRETRFLVDYPDKYKKLIPYIKEVDERYKEYIPDKYKIQKRKANQTFFKIDNTSFTTITTNVNFQTTIHKDTGDDAEGFGNLSIIEMGEYTGGETCFPQYGIGVDVRDGDVLFMDVHEWHGNLPMQMISENAKRLAVVCYLRHKVWELTKNKTRKFMIRHNKTIRGLRKY
jgi:hypothetical protein